jgi:putative PEP-CTERM system TPR-repeat lipoprotein
MITGRLLSSTLVIVLCALTLGCGAQDVPQDPRPFIERGDRFMADSKYAEATIEFRNAVQADPKSGAARGKLADAYANAGDAPKALREYVIAGDLSQDDLGAQLKAGQALLLARRFEDAHARAESILGREATNVAALILKGSALAGLKDLDAAVREINDAIAADPGSARAHGVLGVMEMNRGRVDEAEAAFLRGVSLEPQSAKTHMALANFYWAAGQRPKAEAPLHRALDLEPENVSILRALALLFASEGRPADAEAPLRKVAAIVKDVPSRLMLADYYLSVQRDNDAAPILQAIAREPSGFALVTLRLAASEHARNRPVEANRALEEVLGRQPKNVEALVLKARFRLAEGKVDEALVSANAAVAADPSAVTAHYVRGTIEALKGNIEAAVEAFNEVTKLNPRVVSAYAQLARLQLQRGDARRSVELAEQAVKLAPADPAARLVLAAGLLAGGEGRKAESIMRALLVEQPNAAAIHAQMAQLLLVKGDRAGARREFNRAHDLAPNAIESLRGRIAMEMGDNNAAKARSLVEGQLARTPNSPAALLLAADVYVATGDMARQEALLRRVTDADPSNVAAYIRLASMYVAQGKLDQARTEYEQIWKQRPDSVAAGTMVGMILEGQNKPAAAQEAYERVLRANSRAVLASNNLAYLYAEHGGNLDVALRLAQTAKEQAPELPNVDDTLGWIYLKKDLATLAIPAFEAAVARAPGNATYHFHLGLAYAKANDRAKAGAAYEAALKLRPDFPDAQAAKAALK